MTMAPSEYTPLQKLPGAQDDTSLVLFSQDFADALIAHVREATAAAAREAHADGGVSAPDAEGDV